jgi:hypothetical protein
MEKGLARSASYSLTPSGIVVLNSHEGCTNYSMTDCEYITLSDQSLGHVSTFEWSDLVSYLPSRQRIAQEPLEDNVLRHLGRSRTGRFVSLVDGKRLEMIVQVNRA